MKAKDDPSKLNYLDIMYRVIGKLNLTTINKQKILHFLRDINQTAKLLMNVP